MQTKVSKTGLQARDAALKGALYVAEAVKNTIGPHGSNALIEKGETITNDGYKISTELCGAIEDEFERRGAVTMHNACAKTNDMVGDATSTTEALWTAIVKESIKYLPNEKSLIAKKTPSEVLQMLQKSKDNVIEKLKSMATMIESEKQLINSAKVSVENEELANLIGKTQWKLGPDGVIIAEETNESESSIQIVKGIRIDNGFGASVMINNPEKGTLELSNASTILTNYTIGDVELNALKESIFKPLLSSGKNNLIIIARGFTANAIKLCQESMQAGFLVWPINAPYTNQTQVMKDLEAVLGGRYFDVEETELLDIQLSDVGYCEKLVASRFDTIITGTDNEQATKRTELRLNTLEAELKGESSDFAKTLLETRISQLKNGSAILKVGAPTTTSRKYLKDKADDAVNAVRRAFKGGTVKGAGLAFKEISDTLEEGDILKIPLLAINQQITLSAPKDFVVEEWVRDPYLVLKTALENAVDGAGTFATIGCVIATENKPKCNHDKED